MHIDSIKKDILLVTILKVSDELLDFIDWEGVWREYNICRGWKSVAIDNKWYLVNI
jgi:hypothetical protein